MLIFSGRSNNFIVSIICIVKQTFNSLHDGATICNPYLEPSARPRSFTKLHQRAQICRYTYKNTVYKYGRTTNSVSQSDVVANRSRNSTRAQSFYTKNTDDPATAYTQEHALASIIVSQCTALTIARIACRSAGLKIGGGSRTRATTLMSSLTRVVNSGMTGGCLRESSSISSVMTLRCSLALSRHSIVYF